MEVSSPLLSFLRQTWEDRHGISIHFNLFVPLLVFLVPLFLLKLRSHIPSGERMRLPPNPPTLPFIGNLHQLGTLPHRSLRVLSNKYGPVMLLHLGHSPTIVVSSEKVVSEMVRTHDVAFSNRPKTTAADVFLYGCEDVVFSPHGEYWRQARKVCALGMLSPRRVQSFHFVKEEEVALMVDRIRQECLNRNPVDFCTGLIARMKETAEGLNSLFEQIVEEHKKNLMRDDKPKKKDFLQFLLQSQNDERLDFQLTHKKLKAILLDMFVAGTDTTFTVTEWAVSELIKNPTSMKKAQEEIRRIVGTKSKVVQDDIVQMEYLKCVIKETLRLHPPATLLVPRETTSPVTLSGYNIPAKTKVIINAWAIQRDPQSWDRAEEFLPERFENSPIDYKGQDFQFIPFGVGRRSCPGMSFGVATAEYMLANLLCWFNWKLPGDAVGEELDMTETYGMAVARKNPLFVVPVLNSP